MQFLRFESSMMRKQALKSGYHSNLRMDFFGPRTSLCVHFTVIENATI